MSNNKTGLRHAMLNSDTLAGEFCEILTLDEIFGDLVQCEGGLPMPFEANVPNPSTGEMLGVAEGVGGLTEGASTSILVPDYQGVYKEVAANTPAREGGRVVHNLFAGPTDALATETVTVVVGQEYRVSMEGTGSITISGAASEVISGAAGQRKCSAVLTATTTSLVCTVSGAVTDALCEDVSGKANQNPSEYVSSRVVIGGEFVTNGTFDTDVADWDGLQGTILFDAGKCRLTTIAGNAICRQEILGLVPNTQYLVSFEQSAGNISGGRVMVGTVASGADLGASAWNGTGRMDVLFTAGATNHIAFQTTISGTSGDYQFIDNVTLKKCPVSTKIFAREQGNTVSNGVVTEASGAWIDPLPRLIYAPESTNYFINSHAPVTQTVSGRTGTHTVWCEGAGSVTLSGGLIGVVSDGVPITGDPGGADVICTVAGALDFVMFEDSPKQTYPIPTAGAPVTRTARALSFDGANHDPDQSGYYLEWEPMGYGGGVQFGILTFTSSNSSAFYHPSSQGPLRLRQWYSPHSNAIFNDGLSANEVHHSGFVIDTDVADSLSAWDNDPGVWTTPMASAGSVAVSTINLGQDSPYVIKFGPIRRYQAPLEDMKAQLEADIAAGEAA